MKLTTLRDSTVASPTVDVVYVVGEGSPWNDNELRFSLRSLARFFPEVGKVWVVGKDIPWLRNVRHLPFPDPYTSNKDANIIVKTLRACIEPELSEAFVRFSDDQYLLLPTSRNDLGPYSRPNILHTKDFPATEWGRRIVRTGRELARRGLPTLNYESHVPVLYSKQSFAETMLAYDYGRADGYAINSLYFNSVGSTQPVDLQDARVRAAIYRPGRSRAQFQAFVRSRRFLNHNDFGLDAGLRAFIAELFPKPSPYEA